LGVLFQLRDELAQPEVSRRAAYSTLDWLADLPPHPDGAPDSGDDARVRTYTDMLVVPMGHLFRHHGVEPTRANDLAKKLVGVAMEECAPGGRHGEWQDVPQRLAELLVVAEFLAREGRTTANVAAREETTSEVSP
jgi:hypothetical protein